MLAATTVTTVWPSSRSAPIALFEINEAFCTMAVASTRAALGIDHDIANVKRQRVRPRPPHRRHRRPQCSAAAGHGSNYLVRV